MSLFKVIVFTQLCLNGQLLDSSAVTVNEFEIYRHRNGTRQLSLSVSENDSLEFDLHQSLSKFNYSEWIPEQDGHLILDLEVILKSIPPWISIYSRAKTGCIHRITATMKARASQLQYKQFTGDICSLLSPAQYKCLETSEADLLWNARLTTLTRKVKSIEFNDANIESFSVRDLRRLKNDGKWLSDSHVTLCLQECFKECASRDVWGSLKIKLLDTTFWQHLSEDPDKYNERFRARLNLLEFDFLVMPMFNNNHWRLGIVEKPGQIMEGKTVFHVLDSLEWESFVKKEAKQLQLILLKHFEDGTYVRDRIQTNVAKVPQQPNSNDCGCFVIFFARKFLQNPEDTLNVINEQHRTPPEAHMAWGLRDRNLKFVRREIVSLIVRYILQGDAVVKYD